MVYPRVEKIRTGCNRDCPDACGLIATVTDGRVTRLSGDPEHPVTRGFLCHRTNRFLKRQYDPTRLTTPLIRIDDAFHPIDWQDALNRVADKMRRIKTESGGAAILHYRCGGSLGLMKHLSDYFFERFGPVTIKSGDICGGAGDAAQMLDFGECDSNDLFDLENSKTIVLWGKNIFVSQVHLIPLLKQARRNGARLIAVNPVHNRTAEFSDVFIQPRPGGDMALAFGVARVLFERDWIDTAAESYCDHLAEYRSIVFSRAVAEWAEMADVEPGDVIQLAEMYADGPSAIVMGWGMQRRSNGAAIIRSLDALATVSGNIGVRGGGASFYYRRRGAFDMDFIQGPAVAPRTIPEALLGPGILAAADPPIRMAWVTAANPVAMLPDSTTVADALQSREFTVVVDSFLTDTARCADLVLPTTTLLEDDDLIGAYGHHWLTETRPAIAPPDGVKTDYQIVQELARRLSVDGGFENDVTWWKRRFLKRLTNQGVTADQFERGPVRNPFAPEVLFSDRHFDTPTGRVNLIDNAEPTPDRPSADRPLFLMALSTENAQGSQWIPGTADGVAPAIVHPDAAMDFHDGETALLESDRGRLTVRLQFDVKQRRDVVIVPKGGWLSAGRCANALTSAKETDAGGCAVYYETPVRLRK